MKSTDLHAPAGTTVLRPVTAQERARRAAANAGEPTLEFDGQVPYDAYVRASTLHRLQQPLGDDPGEMSFLMVSQIMELYFKLTCFELRGAQELLRADRVTDALAPLRRAGMHLEGLNGAWRGLRWMTPADFNRFRNLLGEASGLQSAMYRHLEILLGLRNETLIRPFRRQTDVYADLVADLHAPSLWDDVLALLGRQGHPLPADLPRADPTTEHTPYPEVEAAWVRIYADPRPENHLWLLGEALTLIAEEFGDWRYHHLKAVQRAMGAKVGSGGSNGLAWLQRSMARVVFPELWSARTAM
ncbi:tryptophan 2,3-dioxygenase [Micromonospora echinofusca]|uniref:Tryptophan 2,3-dioxygenase n=1 Tax=Micromonospora echinofusca TaxID=47858 RepID=A0ABS3VPD8_MICEH|nr:tryptophan 2,3-dioxygenase family protein [Micromonospora echinofusca]MBO4206408.1 tryptophan 2,3-dioxygenase [Micromonospora echinofusca]